MTIAPLWADSSGALVNISLGAETCARAAPTLALSPAVSERVDPGTAVTYTVSVTNNDNGACAAAGFALQAVSPAGWTAAFAQPRLNLPPGASAATTLTVTSPAADGFYPVAVTVSHSAALEQAASGSVTYVVSASSSDDLTLSGLEPNRVRAGETLTAIVAGSGFAPGIQVQLRNGSGPALDILQVVRVDDAILQVTIDAKRGGPPRPRNWDVVVNNPDGGSAALRRGW